MKRLNQKICALFALLFLLSFCACGKEAPELPEAAESESKELYNAYYFTGASEASLLNLRDQTDAEDKSFAYAYLGRTDGFADTNGEYDAVSNEALQLLLERGGYAEAYPFLTEIPADRIVLTGGTELFCIVPLAESEGITVWRCAEEGETDSGNHGDKLAYTNFDSPLLICANLSDGSLGAYVEIRGDRGAHFVTVSGGAVPEDAYDFSIAPAHPSAAELAGTWAAHGLPDDNDSVRTVELDFAEDGGFVCRVISEDEGFFNGKTILRFFGSWRFSDGVYLLDSMADGGSYIDGGVPPFPLAGEYELLLADGVLSVRRLSGDGFFQGISDHAILMDRMETAASEQ